MILKIEINTENDAFRNGPLHEIERLLTATVHALSQGTTQAKLRDLNGNTVGSFRYGEK